MAVIDVVSWDASPGVFAWKFPANNLSTWTQLIVRESQEAVMLKDGKCVGPFGAGRHTLSSDNYPILQEFFSIPFGKSPYFAEVWFVQKAFTLDVKWGTSDPIQLEDPEYHIMLPVRAFGQYGISIDDAAKFLVKMVGTLPAFTQKTLNNYFKGIVVMGIKDQIAKYLVEKNISILKISAHLNEIADFLEAHFAETFSDYGIKLVNFTINSISTDEADPAVIKLKEAMASRAEMQILGYDYRTKRSFDTMESAASNTGAAGGAMGLGMGFGAGMGMAVPMGNMMGNMAQNLSTEPKQKCPKCGTENPQSSKFCAGCGSMLGKNNSLKCSTCGAESARNMKFCASCGKPFNLCPECGADNPKDAVQCTSCGKQLPANCPKCGAKVASGMKFCPGCGQSMVASCPQCGKECPPGMKFCPQCGTKIG